MRRRARRAGIVLFNLGGPDSLEAVRPFLFNLFSDPAILRAPGLLRWLLARLISRRRAPTARETYGKMGGCSPILGETEIQRDALLASLRERRPDAEWKAVISMRYWHPRADEAAAELAGFRPDRIALLPLYPQYSTTTTGSSLEDWMRAAAAAGLDAPTNTLCCYPEQEGLIAAQVELIAEGIDAARNELGPDRPLRLLLSAHGLPKRVITAGDPYQAQVERTAAAIAKRLETLGHGAIDSVVCYQSRVGPLEWIGPATDAEIARAGADGVGIVIAPIAFVSEHSETLVELDMDYRGQAEDLGVPCYCRVPAVGTHPAFIATLADLVIAALEGGTEAVRPGSGGPCPAALVGCPLAGGPALA